MRLNRLGGFVWFASLLCFLLVAASLLSQHGGRVPPKEAATLQPTTQERLETEPWWPTKSTFPWNAYAGSPSCVACHREQVGPRASGMQRASATGTSSTFLKPGTTIKLKSGPFEYTLLGGARGLNYTISSGPHKRSNTLDWVMGAGNLGYTFLYQADGRWFQSEVTFYTKPAALDITTGLGRSTGSGLPAALGTALSPAEARSCFGCHTVHSTTSSGLNPLHAEPGVGCEACHGPGAQHVRSMALSPAMPAAASGAAVFNPADLSPADSIDFCGACHRTSADARLSTGPVTATSVVRFQPYRLQKSLCWRTTQDQRLTCVACHNPHQPLVHDPASYDGICLNCHSRRAPQAGLVAEPSRASTDAAAHPSPFCPKAASRCVNCHMPKVTVESMHGEFTDHFIRVVKAGEQLPP